MEMKTWKADSLCDNLKWPFNKMKTWKAESLCDNLKWPFNEMKTVKAESLCDNIYFDQPRLNGRTDSVSP